MEHNKYLDLLDYKKIEKLLSPLGIKVLHVLMQQKEKAHEEKKNHQQGRYNKNKKILNFNDDSLSNTLCLNAPAPLPLQIHDTEKSFNFNFNDNIAISIPASKNHYQANKTLESNDFVHPTLVSRNIVDDENNDFVHPNFISQNIEYKDNGKNIECKKTNEFVYPAMVSRNIVAEEIIDSTDDRNHPGPIFEKVNTVFDRHDTLNVNWDNMFDSELFDDTFTIENVVKQNNVNNSNIFNITFNKNQVTAEGNNKKRKNIKNVNKTIKKTKEDKPLKQFPKKAFNESNNKITKTILRKQPYTKTVKNWLSDMRSCNSTDKEVVSLVDDAETKKEGIKIDTTMAREHEHKPVNTDKKRKIMAKFMVEIEKNKKTAEKVQTQLANKAGIMKFDKPKKVPDPLKTVENKELKEKVRNTFISPIISQIPVKDINYQIFSVDDDNVENVVFCHKLNEIVNDEIIVVILYSNGFCQLNHHFTDDSGCADSMLLNTGDNFYCFKGAGQKLKESLARILENNFIISYEARDVLLYLAIHLQIKMNTVNIYDAKIGASLLNPDSPPGNFNDLQKLLSFTPSYTIATECTLQKTAWYILLLKECWAKLKDRLVDNRLWQIFAEIEVKLLPIIAEMEQQGVSMDMIKLNAMEEVLLSRMKQVEQECYKEAGKTFQINSTIQVRNIIYDELQLDVKSNVRIRETLTGGVKSTSEAMLRSLMAVHQLPKLILQYRHLHKAYATFIVGIAQHAKDGVVKPTWVQIAAATGRIASNNPNLQNIPKMPFNLDMFPDPNDTDPVLLNLRSVYVSRPGYSLIAADFKQVECRVFAHIASDTSLGHALTHSDDLFRVLAAQWLNKPENAISMLERENTKRLVYATLYGAGIRKLMEILGISYDQALQVAAGFNRTFPSLKSFGDHIMSQCSKAGGRVSTVCGRVRFFNDIGNKDFNLQAQIRRQAVNFVVQGSAADLCKTAMIQTTASLRNASPAVEARLVLQIHDELVWEVNDVHLNAATGIIKRVMEKCGQHCGMAMPLPVALTVGKSWGEMDNYKVHV